MDLFPWSVMGYNDDLLGGIYGPVSLVMNEI